VEARPVPAAAYPRHGRRRYLTRLGAPVPSNATRVALEYGAYTDVCTDTCTDGPVPSLRRLPPGHGRSDRQSTIDPTGVPVNLNRRLLLRSAAIAVPVAAATGGVSWAATGAKGAAAAPRATGECQSGTGRVIYWGNKTSTDPTATTLMPPVPTVLQSGVTAIAATETYIFALKGGRVWGFGNYSYHGDWRSYPVYKIPTAATSGVTAISACRSSILALRAGRVIAWGQNNGVLLVPQEAQAGVTAIACGDGIALAIKNGGVIQWGDSRMPPVPDDAKSGVVAIAADGHALALREDGRVVAWGSAPFAPATNVPPEAQSGVTAIAAGGGPFSLAVKDGQVFGWGVDDIGQLEAPAVPDVTAIAASFYNGMSLTKQGVVSVWSVNAAGQLEIPDEVCKASAIAMGYQLCVAIV
jgi:alpha-tubulin suppressor-like RCC1 family protein